MTKSYKLFILIFLFITQLAGCAAVGVVAVVSPPLSFADRRSTETQIIDQKNEFKAIIEIQETYDDANVSFVSYNQTLVITGEIPTEELKIKIETLAKNIDGVKIVKNFLLIGKNSSLRSQGLDLIATANVKSRLFIFNIFG